MTATARPEAEWTKPGPGTWELDSSHCGPSPGPIMRGLFHETFNPGFEEGFALFGAPLKGMEMRWVNGRFYRRLVPLIADRDVKRQPPAAALWLATRLHPAFRSQDRQARETFATKRWRSEIERWEHEWKPDLVATNGAFTDVDLASLDDSALAAHLIEVREHVVRSGRLHFRLHVSDMGPLGDLIVHLEDWGLPAEDAFRALVAASPATSAPARQLRRLAATLRASGVDPAGLSSLDEVRAASPDAADQLDAYLREHGWRLTTGYDLEDRCLIELPGVVLASIRSAAGSGEGGPDPDAALAGLRSEVPPDALGTFDELVADARASYGLRDENGPLTYEWPAGLLRRGLLAAGERLRATGALAAADDVFELDLPEVVGLLRGEGGPGPEEIARRAEQRRWEASLEPPTRLGPEEAPPPLSVMPAGLRRTTRIVLRVVEILEAAGGEPLTGTGVGQVAYVGTARVVSDPTEALSRLEPGDVVVAPYTAPTYNAVLAIAGAIVTEEGGLLCHAAVIARELDLPAVVGAADAMERIPDGATVEVDPVAGRVTVLATATHDAAEPVPTA